MSAASENDAALNYAAIIQNADLLQKFEADLREKLLKPDATPATQSGRKEIRSRAYAVARHKTSLDEAGKALGDGFRQKLDVINELRRAAKHRLEVLQMDIGRPVDEWEKQEKARVDYVQNVLSQIDRMSSVSLDDKASEVAGRIKTLQSLDIEHSTFAEMWDAAITNRDKAVDMLTRAVERLEKQEEGAAELAKLRAQAAEREARDAAIIRERELEAIRESQRREEERLEQERAEAARIQAEQFAARAAEDARVKAEKAAADTLAEQQRQHEAEIARIKQEQDAKEVEERQKREVAQAKADADRAAEEKRQSNARHRRKILTEAGETIARTHSLCPQAGFSIAEAIADGRVPHVRMEF